jgi:two-component system OmpR family sensor kinase/two-component system sensor histidine kinase BaeS
VAVLFAIVFSLVAVGVMVLVRGVSSAFPWMDAWPVRAGGLVVATGTMFVVAMRWVGTPLTHIVAAAHRVATGDLSAHVAEDGLPWLRAVARAFNTMTEGLKRQREQRRALTADIAHELRTPLAVIQGRVEGMLDGVYPTDERHIRQVLDETRVLSRLIEDLRVAAEAESGTIPLQRETTDIGALAEDVARGFGPEAAGRQVRIDVHVQPGVPPVEIDPHRMRQVLSNLLSNAMRYSPAGGVVHVECTGQPGAILVRVTDEGPGIAAHDRVRVFDRFYKDSASKGSGLGLAIARDLVAAHGGQITVEDSAGPGATLSVRLPVT